MGEAAFSRNLGFMLEIEQARLQDARVSVAGAGGDGGMLAVQLARMGVGTIRLADPEVFDTENINRQACSTHATIGLNKAEVVGSYLREINQNMDVRVYQEGVTADNVGEFLADVDLVIDETEFTMPALGVMIAREARRQNVPSLMAINVGFGTAVTSFHPKGRTFETFLGLSEQAALEAIKPEDVALARWLAYVPPYLSLEMLSKVMAGEKSAPSVAPGVAVAAGTAAVQSFLHLTHGLGNNRPRPVYSPRILAVDPYSHVARLIRYPRLSNARYMSVVAINNWLKRVPKVDY